MKFWSFIKWKWNKWETWQKWFIFMAFLFGIGVASDSLIGKLCLYSSAAIFLFFTFKWWFLEPAMNSWKEFKKEQDSLFDLIKDSDKK